MDALQAVFARKSTRKFTNRPVPDEVIEQIVQAGLAAPSAMNAQDWAVIVVKDKQTLQGMEKANGMFAKPLQTASFAVLVCADTSRSHLAARDFWQIDGAALCENMLVAATALGVGSVWLGTAPLQNRMEAQRKLFALPKHIIPHSVLVFGYPENEQELLSTDKKRDQTVIHYEKW